MRDLSVLIPARNEQFLKRTIDDVLANMRADTEIIVVCDGGWPTEPTPDHPRVTLVYHAQARGQRQAVNLAAKLSKAKFVMKLDAHCSVAEGFDVQLIKDYEEGQTVIPRMFNLHAFDWVCPHARVYQGPKPTCCNDVQMEVIWKPRLSRKSDYARFDKDLHFQYWRGYSNDTNETMCFVGACFFMSRERYWQLDGLDEGHGSWGQMGVEMSCKTWLSGGRLVVNKNTWFSHLFRTQEGFRFPYPISGDEQERARKYSQWLWNLEQPDQLPRWDKAVRPLSWIVDKFAPVPEWEQVTA
jgi:glycosyltransferase involved in cell wall biosynthesis